MADQQKSVEHLRGVYLAAPEQLLMVLSWHMKDYGSEFLVDLISALELDDAGLLGIENAEESPE